MGSGLTDLLNYCEWISLYELGSVSKISDYQTGCSRFNSQPTKYFMCASLAQLVRSLATKREALGSILNLMSTKRVVKLDSVQRVCELVSLDKICDLWSLYQAAGPRFSSPATKFQDVCELGSVGKTSDCQTGGPGFNSSPSKYKVCVSLA